MSSEENKKEKFVFLDEEDHPIIEDSGASEFCVGDKVYVLGSDGSRAEGPFLVASVSGNRCILSLENGQAAKNGEEIAMAMLQAA